MTNYDRIAQIIRFLDGHYAEQPDLATLARQVSLSPFHFHRLFSTWAGITPKDFLQCLTVAHARRLLRRGENVLETALDSGLSGPGRLHDLCVQLEAASPGELKSGGVGLAMTCGFANSPFGKCFIAENQRGICHLSFIEDNDDAVGQLQREWPGATVRRDHSIASRWVARIFRPGDNDSPRPLRAYVRGTEFQVSVWRALLRVKPGELTTYLRLARSIGRTASSARAVGSAVGQNRLAFLIPCHRVIRESGAVGDYHWGSERKEAMIAWEWARASQGRANESALAMNKNGCPD
ncbi:MAG TPA: methylated-DNA--[protein]-cysteine S-methyltransferase [Verrucomicrobiae bacterium]|nr:methylated-DNA--[protein]-cysteine S-methyltransferase [Verrucomicrobiae bacterium]